jgi:hypothetical protein
MAAPTGNKNAAKDGLSRKIRVRLPSTDDYTLIMEAFPTPEERGIVLLKAARELASATLIIMADCTQCGEAINAAEPVIIRDGQRICEACLN